MLKSLLKKRESGQISGWENGGERRERSLRAVLEASEAADDAGILLGSRLKSVNLDFGRLYLEFDAGRFIYLVISGPVALSAAGLAVTHEPEGTEGLEAVRTLVGRAVVGVQLEASGALLLDLEGTALRTESGSDYEAWEMRGFDGRVLVSMPGGEVAVWEAAGA